MFKLQTTTKMKVLENIHPGEVLLKEFLEPMGITAYRLSKETAIPQTRISQILKGKRRITADTAIRFERFFGTSAKFWLNLQASFDVEEALKENEDVYSRIGSITIPKSQIQ